MWQDRLGIFVVATTLVRVCTCLRVYLRVCVCVFLSARSIRLYFCFFFFIFSRARAHDSEKTRLQRRVSVRVFIRCLFFFYSRIDNFIFFFFFHFLFLFLLPPLVSHISSVALCFQGLFAPSLALIPFLVSLTILQCRAIAAGRYIAISRLKNKRGANERSRGTRDATRDETVQWNLVVTSLEADWSRSEA